MENVRLCINYYFLTGKVFGIKFLPSVFCIRLIIDQPTCERGLSMVSAVAQWGGLHAAG